MDKKSTPSCSNSCGQQYDQLAFSETLTVDNYCT